MNKNLKMLTAIALLGSSLLTSVPAHAATVTSLGENIDKQKYLSIPEVKKSLDENNEKKCDVYMSVIYDELEGLPIEESEDVTFKLYMDNKVIERSISSNYYFKKVEWIKRSGVWSLSIHPTNSFKNGDRRNDIITGKSWNILRNAYSSDYRWNKENEDVLKQQYYCHVNYGALKTPWNIEPSKSSINSITCN
ncbi:DUF2599 domain-containing protein [Clostridium botulinum]|uniref:DUF2599 domain-containing protein n=1 Tax=Clostridium sp. ZBS18 TaxID=2949967 RepID=UPI001D8F8D44|nr:DUF2599 domain-containing protein [Clostridium sp. ZBS18]MBN1056906.1 DUF2599 domain-containing protein [Clostridium botulinum]